MVKVSIIVTVFNEQATIQELLSALYAQTRKPQEIIIVDAVSTDSTWDILQKNAKTHSYLKILQKKGNRSVGRNEAIQKATGNIIAITDAGCVPHKNWLEELIKPFDDKTVQVVSGYYAGIAKTSFEKSVVPYVLVMPDQIKQEFFPSTRSMALRKDVWNTYGGFNEENFHSEDYEYAHMLHNKGIRFIFAQNAVVGWIPRTNIKQVAWMFLRFAVGDIIANIYRPKVKILAIRYIAFTYLCFLALQIPLVWLVVISLAVLYLVWSIRKNYKYVSDVSAVFWLPILQITADTMVLFGTLIGLFYKMGTPKTKS